MYDTQDGNSLGPIVWKPINTNTQLKINQGFHLVN